VLTRSAVILVLAIGPPLFAKERAANSRHTATPPARRGEHVSTKRQTPSTSNSTPTTQESLLAELGQGFGIHKTEHFALAYNTDPQLARQVAKRVERTYGAAIAFCRFLRIQAITPSQPLEVVLFDRYEQYADYGRSIGFSPKHTRGFYDGHANRSAFYNAFNDPEIQQLNAKISLLATRPDAKPARLHQLRRQVDYHAGTVLQTAMRHETAHQVLYNCGVLSRSVPTPLWLAEGLACLFEVQAAGPRRHLPVNQPRLEKFNEVAAHNALLPLTELLTARPSPKIELTHTETFYAQSWAMCYYLTKYRPRPFAAYLKLIRARSPTQEPSDRQELADFEQSFGPPNARFEQTWVQAMLRLQPSKTK
jgi:hypothetical protein